MVPDVGELNAILCSIRALACDTPLGPPTGRNPMPLQNLKAATPDSGTAPFHAPATTDLTRRSGRLLPKVPRAPHLQQIAGDGCMPPLETIAHEINIRLQRAAQADDHRISAGKLLIEARERVEAGEAGDITWSDWVKQHIDRSPGDVRKVMALARAGDPEAARGKEKETAKKAMALLRHERANVSAVPRPCAGEPAADPLDELLVQWRRLSSSKRGELLRQLWLALPTTEQSEFLSWLAPGAKVWSIRPESSQSLREASKPRDAVTQSSSSAEGEEPAETPLDAEVCGEQTAKRLRAAVEPPAAVQRLASREAAVATDTYTPAAQAMSTDTTAEFSGTLAEELIEIVKELKRNTQLRAVSWVACGCPDPQAWDDSVVMTEALKDFREAVGKASEAEVVRFLDLSVAEGWRQPTLQAA